MHDWTRTVSAGFAGWVVMIAGAAMALVGVAALLAGADASPTAIALLSGAALIGLGGILTRDDGLAAGASGSIWQALIGDTQARADVIGGGLPEHLRGLFSDLARGTAAARYVEMSRTLEKQLKVGTSLPDGADPVDAVAAAIAEMSRASVQEAFDTVATLRERTAEPSPAGPMADTTIIASVPSATDGADNPTP